MTRCMVIVGVLALGVLGCDEGAMDARPVARSGRIPIRKDAMTIDFKGFVETDGGEGRGARFVFGNGYAKAIANVRIQLVYKNNIGKRVGTLEWSPEAAAEWLASGADTDGIMGSDLPPEAVSVDVKVLEISFVDGTQADLGFDEEKEEP